MSNINKRLNELSPHVSSIRFTNGISVIDSFFKDGWSIPKSTVVGYETLPDKPNYYMLYPLKEDVGIDEMLDYVSHIIKVNVEREIKLQLVQEKIKELKQIFAKNSLIRCKTLKFTFSDEKIESDEDITLDDIPFIEDEGVNEEVNEEVNFKEVSDKDIAEFNNKTAKVNNETFDLPPKKGEKILLEDYNEPDVVCKCDPNDPNQMCPVCVEY